MKRYIKSDSTEYLYEDPEVRIAKYVPPDKVCVYQYTDYISPLGKQTEGWLCAGIWKKYPDNLWYEWDTVTGGKLSDGASDFEEIADIVRADV